MRTTDLSLLWKLRKRKSKSHYRTKGRVPKWGVVWLTGCWLLAGAEVAHADFFKWEVLVYPEGWGTAYVTFPVTNEGVVYKKRVPGGCATSRRSGHASKANCSGRARPCAACKATPSVPSG